MMSAQLLFFIIICMVLYEYIHTAHIKIDTYAKSSLGIHVLIAEIL